MLRLFTKTEKSVGSGSNLEGQPGDMIQVQPDDDQGDDEPHVHEADDEPRWWERN